MKELIKKRFPEFQDTLVHFIEEHGQIKEFKAGDSILRKGQYFKYTMLLLEGKIKLYRQGEQGDEFFMYHISPGEACALSMICASKSEQSEVLAKAIEDITLIAIPIEFMDEMMVQFKSWYYFVLETYRKRFEELISVIDAIAFRSMDERLEFYLLKLLKENKKYELNLTHQEIANDINSSREVISRLLKKMEQDKLIILHRNMIEIRIPFLQRHQLNPDMFSS